MSEEKPSPDPLKGLGNLSRAILMVIPSYGGEQQHANGMTRRWSVASCMLLCHRLDEKPSLVQQSIESLLKRGLIELVGTDDAGEDAYAVAKGVDISKVPAPRNYLEEARPRAEEERKARDGMHFNDEDHTPLGRFLRLYRERLEDARRKSHDDPWHEEWTYHAEYALHHLLFARVGDEAVEDLFERLGKYDEHLDRDYALGDILSEITDWDHDQDRHTNMVIHHLRKAVRIFWKVGEEEYSPPALDFLMGPKVMVEIQEKADRWRIYGREWDHTRQAWTKGPADLGPEEKKNLARLLNDGYHVDGVYKPGLREQS